MEGGVGAVSCLGSKRARAQEANRSETPTRATLGLPTFPLGHHLDQMARHFNLGKRVAADAGCALPMALRPWQFRAHTCCFLWPEAEAPHLCPQGPLQSPREPVDDKATSTLGAAHSGPVLECLPEVLRALGHLPCSAPFSPLFTSPSHRGSLGLPPM